MGTRHLSIIKKDNEIKLCQYWQWDWYPSWQGVNILAILHRIDIPTLMDNVDTLIPTSDTHVDTLTRASTHWEKKYPQFSRDTWTNIIQLIHDTPNLKIFDPKRAWVLDDMQPNFYIEYSYLVDLDNDRLELYVGTPLDKDGNERKPDYSCDLHNLPDTEAFLLATNHL